MRIPVVADRRTAETDNVSLAHYEITFRGAPSRTLEAAFEEFELRAGRGVTILAAALPDQAALHGVLGRIADLGLELLDVHRVGDESDEPEGA